MFASVTASAISPAAATQAAPASGGATPSGVQQSSLQLWLQDQLAKIPLFEPLVMQARQAVAMQEVNSPDAAAMRQSEPAAGTAVQSQQVKRKGPARRPVVLPAEKPLWDMFVVLE